MHVMRRIEAIKSGADGDISPSAIRGAVEQVEASTPIGAVLSTVVSEEYLPALIEASEDRSPAEEHAWLTLAAAGSSTVRNVLGWRATDLLDPRAVAEVLVSHPHEMRAECERRAQSAGTDEGYGAWMVLACLAPDNFQRLVIGRPRLRARLHELKLKSTRRARRNRSNSESRGRVVNRQIAAQFQALGLA